MLQEYYDASQATLHAHSTVALAKQESLLSQNCFQEIRHSKSCKVAQHVHK